MAYTHTELLDELKVRGMIPTANSTFTTARFLAGINSTMRVKILPLVLKFRESFYSYDQDFSISSTGEYVIPSRAIAAKLDNVALINSTQRQDLNLYFEDELQDTDTSPDNKPGFTVKRSSIWLIPKSGSGFSTLRMTFFIRPAEVVAQSSAAQITTIDTATKTLTFASGTIPSTWTTSQLFELVQQNPHFDTLGYDLVVTSVTATTMVFSATLPTRLAVGDWVGLTGQTPVIQCPVELQPLLAQEVANYCLRGQGDGTAYKHGVEEAKMIREDIKGMFTPRIEREGKKLTNRTGILRRGL